MTQQHLELEPHIDATPWHLDDETRRIGREGVASARAALAHARRHTDDEHTLAA